MSKIVYICYRKPTDQQALYRKLEQITLRLSPDNIAVWPTKVINYQGVIYGLYNPVSIISETNGAVLLGVQIGNDPDWWKVQSAIPDGSFALFRSNEHFVEVATDAAGSRSTWYFSNDDLFISSTSQRAIVAILGDFQLNKKVLPWMLSSGTIGPSYSWDSRINLLRPNSMLTLNRFTWEIQIETKKVEFIPEACSDEIHEDLVKRSLIDTFSGLNLDVKKWILPISGGYDSRSILLFLNLVGTNIKELRTATWGMKESLDVKNNDAYVASKLASYFNLPHRYYSTDLAEGDIEDVFDKFIRCGEGRTDHIGGYLDGFKIWKDFFESNIEGVISGHVSYSQKASAISSKSICSSIGMVLCEDFSNLQMYKDFGMSDQEVPTDLKRQGNESLEDYRDRLYREFRIPVVLSALNEVKSSYVEVLTPLLSERILERSSKLPSRFRSGKSLFKKVVNSISPDVDYATEGANEKKRNVFKSKAAVSLFHKVISTNESDGIFSNALIEYILNNLKPMEVVNKREKTWKEKLFKYVPEWIIKNREVLGVPKANVDCSLIAFRMYMVIKMNQLLIEDAESAQINKE